MRRSSPKPIRPTACSWRPGRILTQRYPAGRELSREFNFQTTLYRDTSKIAECCDVSVFSGTMVCGIFGVAVPIIESANTKQNSRVDLMCTLCDATGRTRDLPVVAGFSCSQADATDNTAVAASTPSTTTTRSRFSLLTASGHTFPLARAPSTFQPAARFPLISLRFPLRPKRWLAMRLSSGRTQRD